MGSFIQSLQTKRIFNLQQSLNKLEEKIVLSSDKDIEERIYAISEIRYYKDLMISFFDYPENLKVDIISDMSDMLGEVELWLQQ